VIAGRSSFLPLVSRNSIYLVVYRMNLVAVRNAELLGEENVEVVMVSHDRCIL